MPQSLARALVHLVFSTKQRTPLPAPEYDLTTKDELYATANILDY